MRKSLSIPMVLLKTFPHKLFTVDRRGKFCGKLVFTQNYINSLVIAEIFE